MKLYYCIPNRHYTLKEECHGKKTVRKVRVYKPVDKDFELRRGELRNELEAIPCLTLKYSHNQP